MQPNQEPSQTPAPQPSPINPNPGPTAPVADTPVSPQLQANSPATSGIQQPVPQPVAAAQPFTPISGTQPATPSNSKKILLVVIAGIGTVFIVAAILTAFLVFNSHKKQAEAPVRDTKASDEQKSDKKLTEVVKPPTVTGTAPSQQAAPTQSGQLPAQYKEQFLTSCKSDGSISAAGCACMLDHFEKTMTVAQFEEFDRQVLRELANTGELSQASLATYQKAFAACGIG